MKKNWFSKKFELLNPYLANLAYQNFMSFLFQTAIGDPRHDPIHDLRLKSSPHNSYLSFSAFRTQYLINPQPGFTSQLPPESQCTRGPQLANFEVGLCYPLLIRCAIPPNITRRWVLERDFILFQFCQSEKLVDSSIQGILRSY